MRSICWIIGFRIIETLPRILNKQNCKIERFDEYIRMFHKFLLLGMTLSGYLCKHADRLRTLLKFVLLMTHSLLKFFLHRSIWIQYGTKGNICHRSWFIALKKVIVKMILKMRFVIFTRYNALLRSSEI